MFCRIGTSAEPHRASSPARRIGAALALTILLAATVVAVRFRTVAADGTARVRSAPLVWTIAAANIRRNAPTPAMYAIYAVSLGATVGGCFLLLWLAAAVTDDAAARGADHLSA